MSDAALQIARPDKHAQQPNPALKKAIAFRRIGTKRVNRALQSVSLLGNLANRSTYSYSEGDVKKMFERLRNCIDTAEAKFTPSYRDQDEFSF